ncbi:50S ribosomal protein L4 [candidate division KSB1 bacterium]|nr:50S ribosomal protein L4 [candidate division KSB1 bacterium]
MELDVYKIDGSPSGEKISLPDEIFNIEPNDHAIYQAVRSFTINGRQGTVATKNRALVRGGGKKPWRQKGRGTARAGTSRSPLWSGGGRIFGPSPRDFKFNLPKKVKKLARKSALTYKAREAAITVVEDFNIEQGKTKEIFNILKNMKLNSKKVLLATSGIDSLLVRAGRNIPYFNICMVENINTYDILNCQNLVLQKSALEKMKEVY